MRIDLHDKKRYKGHFTKAVTKFNKTKNDEDKVYVEVTDKNSPWYGSIGYVKSSRYEHNRIVIHVKFDQKPRSQCHLCYDVNYSYFERDHFVWLYKYEGPTVYEYNPKRQVAQEYEEPVKNSIGQEIKIGDFVAWSSGQIHCGHVEKITSEDNIRYDYNKRDYYSVQSPIVHIRRIKMDAGDKGGIRKCKTIDNIIVIDDKLKQTLMTNLLRMG